jgi:predicted MPP superfamily phosphohydrolase
VFHKPIGTYYLVVTVMIALALGATLLMAGLLWLLWPPLARAFLALAAAGLLYAYAVEPAWVEFRHLELQMPELPEAWDGLRLAQLSDFHLGMAMPAGRLRAVLERVNQFQPDLIVHTGDFFSGQSRGRPPGTEHLGGLRAPLGVYGVLGNHDYFCETPQLLAALDEAGVRLLRNEAVALTTERGVLWLAGVDDQSTGHDDLDQALRQVPPGQFTILLSHSPDLIEEVSDRGVALMLSGHTHGGQVCLPIYGPIFCFSRFYKRYSDGLFRVGPTTLYVNRGLGLALLPFRFFCRPEVTLFTLRRAR